MEDCNKDTKLKIIEMPEEKVYRILTWRGQSFAFSLSF
jgi:hypothetical protein